MSVPSTKHSPKHSKDYYLDYINAEDRLDVDAIEIPTRQSGIGLRPINESRAPFTPLRDYHASE